MTKIKYLGAFLFLFLFLGGLARAESTAAGELRPRLRELVTRLEKTPSLTKSLVMTAGESLRQGDRGEKVKALQEFLKQEGDFTYPTATGYYGEITKKAVEKFQLKHKIISADAPPKVVKRGEVDSVTDDFIKYQKERRQKMVSQKLFLDPVAPPKVIAYGTIKLPADYQERIELKSPNGGEVWVVGGTYSIEYLLGQNYPDIVPPKVLVYLEKHHPAWSSKSGVNSSMLLGISSSNNGYRFTVSDSILEWPGVGDTYKIRVCSGFDCERVNDASERFLTITATAYPLQPVTNTSPATY